MTYLFPDSVLLIFCKAPVAGLVKTRLQPALTAEQSVEVHRELVSMTLAMASRQPLCAVKLYCAPDPDHAFFGQCRRNYPLTLATQRGNDLGERMLNAFSEALACYRHAILIGCDCPSLTVDDLSETLTALQVGYDAVFGPAEDGGYVLVGLNAPQPALFTGMTWGNQAVMAQTRRRAADASLKIYELTQQWDVDTAEDWARFCSSSLRNSRGGARREYRYHEKPIVL
ncbi:MAG: TIGR04282 family arsenosugar biosynthesis glycosyltransferase [Methylomonas sp.]